eukprot:TRINITY_DN76553_c0_g1_i1.p1 TRINITY_DN76553_c0_g1~~TRINITY_DN76553_c0_g1_i1.p1  ORF type:complete len:282 (+),score=34.46 TRINITY_DN76553_c0_g1_i1:42-848(+)
MASAAVGGIAGMRALFGCRGARWVLGGWSLFTLENVILSENKDAIKRAWGGHGGPKAYQNFYSTCSTLAMGSCLYAYWHFARVGTVLRTTRPSLRTHVAAFGWRAAGLVMIGQLLPPFDFNKALTALGMSQVQVEGVLCPWGFDSNKDRAEVYGIARVTRRPELMGLMAVAIGGALKARTAAEVAFFGPGPVVCFIALALHGDRAQRAGGELSPSKEAQTSVLPFMAILDGRQSWTDVVEEIEPINVAVAITLAGVMALRPPWLRWVK